MVKTTVEWNGSKFAGQAPDHLEKLLEVLAVERLDKHFHPYVAPSVREPGSLSFFGNFANLSHSFCITTNDIAVIEKLTAAIRTNPGNEDTPPLRRYKEATARLRTDRSAEAYAAHRAASDALHEESGRIATEASALR